MGLSLYTFFFFLVLFLLQITPIDAAGGLYGDSANLGSRVQAIMIKMMCFTLLLTPYAMDQQGRNNVGDEKIPVTTLQRWKTHYLWWGETPAETRANRRYKRNGSKSMQGRHIKYLKKLVLDEPGLYLDQFRHRMNAKFNKNWSTSCIYKNITDKKKCNLSLQVICFRACQASDAERLVYKNTLSAFDDATAFIFVDETCVGRNDSRRRRHWSERGDTPEEKEVFVDADFDGAVYTMLGAVDINGFIPNVCIPIQRKSGIKDRNELRGTVTQRYFYEWVKSTLCTEIKRRVAAGGAQPVIVMDNATVHKHPRIRQRIEAAGGELVWTAAYSPDLNPIERCFHSYKSFLKRYKYLYTSQFERHLAALTSVSRDNMIGYYNGKALEGCIQNVPELSSVLRDRRTSNNVMTLNVLGYLSGL